MNISFNLEHIGLAARNPRALKEWYERILQAELVHEMQQNPQTLDEEADRLGNDFSRGNPQFDTRTNVIRVIAGLTQTQLADYFDQAVMKQDGLAMLSQVSGNDSKIPQYAVPEGFKTWPDTSTLQQVLEPHADK